MGAHALALLRVRSRNALDDALKRYLGPLAPMELQVLGNDTVVWTTYVRFGDVQKDPLEARILLTTTFGEHLALIHDDPRGVLFFGDWFPLSGLGYDDIVARVGSLGVWALSTPIDAAVLEARASSRRRRPMLPSMSDGDATVPFLSSERRALMRTVESGRDQTETRLDAPNRDRPPAGG